MLLFVSGIKLVAEIALMALVAQWLLGLLAGKRRDTNIFYKILQALTNPFVKGARFIAPRIVLDKHVPLVAFFFLLFAWIFATVTKISLCLETGVNLCR